MLQADKLKGSKTTNYRTVLAAIPSSQRIQKINNILNFSGLQILNVGLLPVESASLVDALSNSLNKGKDKTKNNWTVFIAQNSNGGLRQIVTKNGHMALTRMTPLVNTDSDPEVWASEVSQELKATMTYLTRFDYKQDDNLEVIVVANPTAGQVLEGLIEVSCNYYCVTVAQVAERLKISLDRPEESRFIDPVHARWAANKLAFDMEMKPEEVDKISKARLGAIAASLVMAVSFLYFSAQAYASFSTLSDTKRKIVKAKAQNAQADTAYNQAVEKNKDTANFDINLVKGTVEAHEELARRGVKPIDHIKRINEAMKGMDQTFSKIEMEFIPLDEVENDRRQRRGRDDTEDKAKGEIRISIQMIFPGNVAPEKGNAKVERIRQSLQREFEDIGFKAEIEKFLQDMTFESAFEGSAGLSAKDLRANTDFVSAILITGKVS